jgi:WS/DGAT/MGAT family acyltransferase
MTPVDAAWYHMDGPANLAMVTGIVLTKAPLDFEKVKALYRRRLLEFEVFRERVVERGFPIATPHWEDMPNFDIDQHFHHIGLPAPGGKAALASLVSDLASTPLDRERPLWQIHVVDDVDGGSALIMRYHHCIGDGTAMNTVTRELFDTRPDAPLAKHSPAAAKADRALADRLLAPALESVERSTRRALATAAATIESVTHPQQLIDKAALVLDGAGMLVKELLKRPDPRSPLKGEFRLAKRVAWSEPVALKDIRAVGAPSDAKINDVLVAAMTGALRAYLKKRGVDVDHMTVRAMVPVDLRPPERARDLGNVFGLVVLELAVSSKDASKRLRLTKANMDALKRSPEAVAIMTLFDIFGRGPKAIEDLAVDLFGSKASVVMTNVRGSQQPLYLAGVPIDRIMFWVPHPGSQLGMGISILSYRGFASLGVVADARLVPDPERITEQFNREFATMLAKVRRGGAETVAPSFRPAKAAKPAPSGAAPGAKSASKGRRRAKKAATRTTKVIKAGKGARRSPAARPKAAAKEGAR